MSNAKHVSQPRKVLLIGWDGADWKVASPLVDAGKMPNLQQLIDTGVMGNISTLYPVLSPMLWTSIATGKRAHKHGIHGFAEPDASTNTVRPITNLGRKCKAIWNILNQNGKRCNVVGWWPSNPAEPINGVMVSNHFQIAPGRPADNQGARPADKQADRPSHDQWPLRPGTIHPRRLADQLSKFRVHPREIEPEQILPFIPDAAKIDQQKDKRITAVAKTLAECSSVHAVATAIMQHEPWDFMAVYYDAIDHFSHGFMKFHPPREAWVPEADFELYRNVMETCYRFHDLMLGVLLNLAGPDTTVILLSDHGFHPDHLRPQMISNEPAGPADEHRQFGMLVLNGPGIQQDELVFGASLLDITPTILTLYGLPIGRDMDGKPLLSALDDATAPEFIDSWESVAGADGRHPQDFTVDPVDAQECLKQLVELGYIEKPDEDQQQATRNTVRELRYNLARDLMDSQDLPSAIAEFSQLWNEFPDESRFGVKLFHCFLQLPDVDNAETTLQQLVAEKRRYGLEAAKQLQQWKAELGEFDPTEMSQQDLHKLMRLRRRAITNSNALAFLRGSLLQAKGEFEPALEALSRADDVQTYNQPSLIQKKGECYLGLQRWSEARSQFEQILQLDPANAAAYLGLAQTELASNRPQKAFAAAKSAIGLIYHNPKAHFVLGSALAKLGRPRQAIDALETALRQNKVFPDCHRLLANIFRFQGNIDKALRHDALASSAENRLKSFQAGRRLPRDTDLELDIAMDQPVGIREIGGTTAKLDPAESVVVVSGLPRSGTSMMMQVLQAGGVDILCDEVRPADDSNPRGYLEYEPVKSLGTNNQWVIGAKGKAVKIVTQLLPQLPRDLKYIVFYMARPLDEVLASQAKLLSKLDRQGGSLSDRQLAATYKQQVDFVSEALEHYQDVVAVNVVYAEALANPSRLARRINALLGGTLDESAMASVIDPTLRNEGSTNGSEA